jgi:16S rRNA G1207 methylase RsmC
MSPEQFIYETLRGAAGVTQWVGTRIYQDAAPNDAEAPYIVITKGAQESERTLDNSLAATRAEMEIGAWAESRLRVESLGDAIAAAMLAATVPESGRSSDYDPASGLYGAALDFDIWD